MKNARQKLVSFIFPVDSDDWLSILRVGLAVQILVYCWSIRADWKPLFRATGEGVINRDVAEAILNAQSPFLPRLGWLIRASEALGLSQDLILTVIWALLFVTGILLLLGLFSKIAAIAAWFLFLCASKSGNLMTYGMDNFTTIGLFYLMLSPLPDHRAIDCRIWERLKDGYFLGFFRRALQLHLCLIYFCGGIAKSLGSGWWNGASLWRALITPPFDLIPSDLLVRLDWLLPCLGIIVVLLELTYPILIWPKRTRLIFLTGIVAMHVAIGFAMGLYLFALIMIILNLAAFGPGLLFPEKPVPDLTAARIARPNLAES